MDGVLAAPGAADGSGDPARRVTALVIDDNERFRTALTRLLRRAGIDVLEAADGARGIALVTQSRPDLVITDIYMPGVGGLPTIAHLRTHWPQLRIVAISGADAPVVDLARRSAELGADAFLSKPFDLEQLMKLIEPSAPSSVRTVP